MNANALKFLLISRALRLDSDGEDNAVLAKELVANDLDWKGILELADHEHMTGAFTAALSRRGLDTSLPRPIRAALNRRYLMATEINTRIKSQIEEVVGTLNAVGFSPLLLKGALYLCEASPSELADRVLRDLDLIVPADGLEECVEALRAKGYVPYGQDERWTYHYRPLFHPKQVVGVELHIRPGEQRHFMGIEEAWESAVPIDLPGLKAMALDPNHRIAHNVFHSEVQDFGYTLGALCLRQLYDLARICRRYETEIDWQTISTRMERHGMAALFRARVYQAVQLLGAPRPSITVDGLSSRLHLSRCLVQLRWPGVVRQIRWLAGVAGPFTSRHLDLMYGCGTKGFTMQTQRVKHAWALLRSHRGHLKVRMAEHGQRLQ